MANVHTLIRKAVPEVRFWACFAVIFALLSQALFPPQVMARQTADGVRFVLCDMADDLPVIDSVTEKLVKSQAKSGSKYQGLKCADCVLASVTATVSPTLVLVPVIYSAPVVIKRFSGSTSPIKARAPPRPHSCGPPSEI